jgi:cytidine deaminase
MAAVDWAALHDAATAVAQRAYAPYSRFRVGAAALTDDGRIVAGCNVENVSYGLTVCAEVTLVGQLHSTGAARLVALAVVTAEGQPCMPCGRCRQVLMEHGGAGLLVDGDGTVRPLAELLPFSFTETDLHERQGR